MAKNNKPASAYADRYKEVDMKGVVTKPGNGLDKMNISVGNVSKGNYAPEKTDGIKIRGTGAATKGTMARGPMA
jgi:hypothetical protein